ncbi:MAG: DsbA family protein [Ignavibacteriae bacterium]|nr:DsbA family protein [Ignavibacteriota bacterium]
MSDETITIKKSTYKKIQIALVVVLVAFAFTGGFVLGGSGVSTKEQVVVQPQQQPQGQQPQQQGPAGRVQVSVDDDPVLGNANAQVTVIEFSDFQCPFCKRFYDDTEGQLKANYIDTGKVKFVYRDFPLSFHQNAEIAAEAADCALEQGKFWEYHDILFTKGSGDGTGLDSQSLKQYAADLKLDTTKFNQCLDSGKYKNEVQKDTTDGSNAGVSGTPTFFIGSPQKGYTMLVGAQPYATFQQAIDQELSA